MEIANSAGKPSRFSRKDADLDSRYGEIGISAVAAALAFANEPKKAADARADHQGDEHMPDAA